MGASLVSRQGEILETGGGGYDTPYQLWHESRNELKDVLKMFLKKSVKSVTSAYSMGSISSVFNPVLQKI